MPDSPGVGPTKALLARAGDCWCAIPLDDLRRVLPAVKLHPLPGAGWEIAGLAEVEGEPLVVLNLERLVEAPPGAAADFPVTLVVAAGARRETIGLAADEAGDIVLLDPARASGERRGVAAGELAVGDRLVRLVALGRLGSES
ncbi:MAG TPA: chemotaxis protein CheW [Thermoanaerobaculia bacterium]|jgi:chemotaxis signal transduction protein|nr:chemotaxis protein CheW [Thermoanaerobaculia bacterium]